MQKENEAEATDTGPYVFGDAGAADEAKLPTNELRKMRLRGLLDGAFVKTGHRSILYHRGKLRQRLSEAFKPQPASD
jgi:hypothetical protein